MSRLSLGNKAVLKQYIDEEGNVDYTRLRNDPWLEEQLLYIRETNPDDLETQKEKFAFWLNAYNLLTLEGVLEELEKRPQWSGNTSFLSKVKFFVLKRFAVGGRKLSLRTLENKIIREKFQDPRIHFAINCGSASCPVLPGRLFQAEELDETLELLTDNFINNPNHVQFDSSTNVLTLNPIFKWYHKDFRPKGVIAFIKCYWRGLDLPDNLKVNYSTYDWSLNKQ